MKQTPPTLLEAPSRKRAQSAVPSEPPAPSILPPSPKKQPVYVPPSPSPSPPPDAPEAPTPQP